jgi:hypothetical protein
MLLKLRDILAHTALGPVIGSRLAAMLLMTTSLHVALQFGTGNAPEDLSTVWGFSKNLAVWSLHKAAPLVIEIIGSPWIRSRRNLGLPRVISQCGLVNAVAWVRRQAVASCTPVVETALTSWLLEYPRPLPPHQVSVCC